MFIQTPLTYHVKSAWTTSMSVFAVKIYSKNELSSQTQPYTLHNNRKSQFEQFVLINFYHFHAARSIWHVIDDRDVHCQSNCYCKSICRNVNIYETQTFVPCTTLKWLFSFARFNSDRCDDSWRARNKRVTGIFLKVSSNCSIIRVVYHFFPNETKPVASN